MRTAARVAIVLYAVALGFGACRSSRSGAAPDAKGAAAALGPVVVVQAGGRAVPFRVELATTDGQRERGLMYRNHLDPDAGMLFVFERDAPLAFWMKNTFIPLDIIFIGRNRRIVGIVENAAPQTESPRRVEGMSRYVLEIAGGLSKRLGIVAGGLVEFQGMGPEVLGSGLGSE